MSVAATILSKLWGILLSIIGVLKRLICRFRRGRKNSGTILPMTTPHLNNTELHQSVPSNDTSELQSWDSWEANNLSAAETQQNRYSRYSTHLPQPDPEPEPDFFQDMTPQLRKTPKILLKKKDNFIPGTISSRLTMAADAPPVVDLTYYAMGNELDAWEEGGGSAWGEEGLEDLSLEADEAIRERKRQERYQRQLEQQRKKLERDAKRSRKDSGSMSAVKLS